VLELRALRVRQAEERLRRGVCPDGINCRRVRCPGWHDLDLVFAQPNGKPLHWDNLRSREFASLVKAAEIPRIRPYDLRHLHLTVLAESGVHPAITQARAGHSCSSFTIDHYTHVTADDQQQAAAIVDQRWASYGIPTTTGGQPQRARARRKAKRRIWRGV
jgi:integrase